MKPEAFEQHNKATIQRMARDENMRKVSHEWLVSSLKHEYPYHFHWMGMPIIQFPNDIVVLQELIWKVQPDLIIETGVARGGSVVFFASMLDMMSIPDGQVIGIDIEIRSHNREAIEAHPMAKYITLLEGSSTDDVIVQQVAAIAGTKKKALVVLDSMHTHEHVLQELKLYSPFVKSGSYIVVLDTLIEDMPDDFYPDRPWSKGDNPKTAIQEFLKDSPRFEIDSYWTDKILVTVASDGFLRCIQD